MPGTTGLKRDQLPSLITDTIAHYKDKDQINFAQKYQNYFAVDQLFKEGQYTVQGGDVVEFRYVTDDKGSARHTTYHKARNFNLKNPALKGTIPWTLADNYAAYSRHEADMNKGQSRVVPYIKKEYFRCIIALLNIIEERFPLAPDYAGDVENPPGLQYWMPGVPAGVENYTGGWIGTTSRYMNATAGDATTYITNAGGLDRIAEPMARCYAGNHQGMGMALLDSMRLALKYTSFTTPRDVRQYDSPRNMKKMILSSVPMADEYDSIRSLASNGGRNGDISPFGTDDRRFRGVRWLDLSQFDDVPLEPIYCVDLAYFFGVVREGWWFREDELRTDRWQPHLLTQQYDCNYSYGCDNPRKVGFSFHRPW